MGYSVLPGGSRIFVHATVYSTKFYYQLKEESATSGSVWVRMGYVQVLVWGVGCGLWTMDSVA